MVLFSIANTSAIAISLGYLYPGVADYTYENEKGEEVTYKPGVFDTIASFIGTVIPWQFFNYDWGEKYGKGEFGKIIVMLMFVSIGIIIIGGLGTSMLLIGFIIYLFKVIGMFTNNIQKKTKK